MGAGGRHVVIRTGREDRAARCPCLASTNGGGQTSRDDLGLQLHWESLLNMTRKRGEYTIEDVQEAFEDSKTVRGI